MSDSKQNISKKQNIETIVLVSCCQSGGSDDQFIKNKKKINYSKNSKESAATRRHQCEKWVKLKQKT